MEITTWLSSPPLPQSRSTSPKWNVEVDPTDRFIIVLVHVCRLISVAMLFRDYFFLPDFPKTWITEGGTSKLPRGLSIARAGMNIAGVIEPSFDFLLSYSLPLPSFSRGSILRYPFPPRASSWSRTHPLVAPSPVLLSLPLTQTLLR